jgi:sodium pump decarboxylase gamma subunit
VSNLGWGLQMMVAGMGLVFGLLALLWGLLALVQRFERESAPAGSGETSAADASRTDEAPVDEAAGAAPVRVATKEGIEADLAAAILIAVLKHKEVRRAQAAPAMRSYWPGSLLYASRWVASGRARQNQPWERRGR